MKDWNLAAVRDLSNLRRSFASFIRRTGVTKPDSPMFECSGL